MSELLQTTPEADDRDEARRVLREFIREITESVQRNTLALNRPLERLTDEERVEFFTRLTGYMEFELLSDEDIFDIPVRVTGGGLMMAFDTDGDIVGVEEISDGDIVVGQIDDAIAQPTLSYVDVVQQFRDGILCDTEVASAVLILHSATYLSGRMPSGEYEYERDLGEFRVGIPLVYPLNVDIDDDAY